MPELSIPVSGHVPGTNPPAPLNPKPSSLAIYTKTLEGCLRKPSLLHCFALICASGGRLLAVGGAIAMDTTNGGDSVERQVQVKFVTKLPPALRVVSSAFAIPAKLGRYGLSEVVNTLLGLGNFIFQGLRAPLLIWSRGAEAVLKPCCWSLVALKP
jgi:hypothetical protein